MHPYTIEIECSYEEFWRYNLSINGALYLNGAVVQSITYRDAVAEVGSKPCRSELDNGVPRDIVLTTEGGDSLTLYIYVVPHTLPISKLTADTPTFSLRVRISHGSDVVYSHDYAINQWSGDNIEIKL